MIFLISFQNINASDGENNFGSKNDPATEILRNNSSEILSSSEQEATNSNTENLLQKTATLSVVKDDHETDEVDSNIELVATMPDNDQTGSSENHDGTQKDHKLKAKFEETLSEHINKLHESRKSSPVKSATAADVQMEKKSEKNEKKSEEQESRKKSEIQNPTNKAKLKSSACLIL